MMQIFLGNQLPAEHTLFKASTGIFCAFMSLRSRSASYFRSLDMLNLRAEHKKSFSPAQFYTASSYMFKTTWHLIQSTSQTWRLNSSYHSAFFLPLRKFSRMIPATVRPFPTPAPSPIRKPALWLFWRITSCCWRTKENKTQEELTP